MLLSIALICFASVLMACLVISGIRKYPRGFPPGYTGIPVLGFLIHFILQKGYIAKLVGLKKSYGSICSVKLGSYRFLCLNDSEVIREAWSMKAFSGRPLLPLITERTHGRRAGIIFNDGEEWSRHHKFVVKSLKLFGFASKNMEILIREEAQDLVRAIKHVQNSPVSTQHLFNVPVVNALWIIVAGERLDKEHPMFTRLIEVLDRNMEMEGPIKAALFLPWLTSLCPGLIGWNKYLQDAHEIFDFWQNYAKAKLKEFDQRQEGNPPENFIQAYLAQIYDSESLKSELHQDGGITSLATTLQDLFIAGTETTATTLRWILLLLASHPEAQERCLKEIQTVLVDGPNITLPSVSDRSRLPFFEATLAECMRVGTLAPLGMFHRTISDVTFHGFFIPKNTPVMSNIAAVHFDPELWPEPEKFIPERFLYNGKFTSFKHFIPFGHGKRKCIGEAVAKDQLFIFVAAILLNFQVILEHPVSLEPKVGVSASPQSHKIIFTPRRKTVSFQ